MSARAWKPAAALLLAVVIAVQLLEISGRWDETFQDANDEAAIVAVVLCVGLALTTAATLMARPTATRQSAHLSTVRAATSFERALPRALNCRGSSPPLSLRI